MLTPSDAARAQDLDAGLWLRCSPVEGGPLDRHDMIVPAQHPGLCIFGIA